MPAIRLNLNLGCRDACYAGLTTDEATEGTVVTVGDTAATVLIERGWAVLVPYPVHLRAVPPIELKARPDLPRGKQAPKKGNKP